MCGVAIVGRPVARGLADGETAEVTRLCVDTDTLDSITRAFVGGALFAAREQGLRGVAFAEAGLTTLRRSPFGGACSMLYAAAWRAARALGYRRLVTYTLEQEPGASLRAAGWRCVGRTAGGSWSRTSRPRLDWAPTAPKNRWEAA
jgi:hypothetical protein